MTSPDQFVAFLSAYVELNPNTPPTAAQWAIINAKLDSCFNKVTPDRAVGAPAVIDTSLAETTTATDGRRFYVAPGDNWKGILNGTGDMTKFTFSNVATTC